MTSECALCRLRPFEEGRSPQPGFVVSYVGDDLIGLVPRDSPGFLIAPRQHIRVLFDVPEQSGLVLAAIRRGVDGVKAAYGVAEATVRVTTEVPDTSGHLCYHVAPVLRGDGAGGDLDTAIRARQLADALRRPAVPPWHQEPHARVRRRSDVRSWRWGFA